MVSRTRHGPQGILFLDDHLGTAGSLVGSPTS